MKQSLSIVLVIIVLAGIFNGCKQKPSQKRMTLLVIFDGLRPEYITPEIMPNTYKLKMEGVLASEHRSVFLRLQGLIRQQLHPVLIPQQTVLWEIAYFFRLLSLQED